MDGIVTHKYAVGTAAELRGNGPDKLEQVSRPEDANLNSEGLIALPRFVGVYQEREPSNTGNLSEEELEVLKFLKDRVYDGLSAAAKVSIIKNRGVKDSVYPSLIHVIHGSAVPRDVVRMGLEDEVGRVAFSPIGEQPNFYEKDVGSVYLAAEAGAKIFEGDRDEDTFDVLERSLGSIQREMSMYGLTREEYALLHTSRKLSDKPSGVSDNPVMLKIISGLLGLD